MSRQSGPAGGYLIDQSGLASSITRGLQRVSPVREVATVVTTVNGARLAYPTCDDTDQAGSMVTEAATISQATVTVGAANLRSYEFVSGILPVPYELFQAVADRRQRAGAGARGPTVRPRGG